MSYLDIATAPKSPTSIMRVAIFFDLENCAIPSKQPPTPSIIALRDYASKLGNITLFNAYANVDFQTSAVRTALLRCGVHVCDVPEPRKNAADMMLLSDLIAFVLDNPPDRSPSTIIIVSNDAGFAPAVHKLVHQSYPVHVIAHLSHCPPALQCATPHVIDWQKLCQPHDSMPGSVLTSQLQTLGLTSHPPVRPVTSVNTTPSPSTPKPAASVSSESAAPEQWQLVQKKPRVRVAPTPRSNLTPTKQLRLTPENITRFSPLVSIMRKHAEDNVIKLPRAAGIYRHGYPKQAMQESFHDNMVAAVAIGLVVRVSKKSTGGGSLRLLCDDWFPSGAGKWTPVSAEAISSDRYLLFLAHALENGLSLGSRTELNNHMYQFFKPTCQDNLQDVWLRLEQLGVTTFEGSVWHADAARNALDPVGEDSGGDSNGYISGSVNGSIVVGREPNRSLFTESKASFMYTNIRMLKFMSARVDGHVENFPTERAVWSAWFDVFKLKNAHVKRSSLLGSLSKHGIVERKLGGVLSWKHDVIRVFLGQAPLIGHSFNVAYTSFLSFVCVNQLSFTDVDQLKRDIQTFLLEFQRENTFSSNNTDGELELIMSQLKSAGISTCSATTGKFMWSLDAAATSLLTLALSAMEQDVKLINVALPTLEQEANMVGVSSPSAMAQREESVTPVRRCIATPVSTSEQGMCVEGMSSHVNNVPYIVEQEANQMGVATGSETDPTTMEQWEHLRNLFRRAEAVSQVTEQEVSVGSAFNPFQHIDDVVLADVNEPQVVNGLLMPTSFCKPSATPDERAVVDNNLMVYGMSAALSRCIEILQTATEQGLSETSVLSHGEKTQLTHERGASVMNMSSSVDVGAHVPIVMPATAQVDGVSSAINDAELMPTTIEQGLSVFTHTEKAPPNSGQEVDVENVRSDAKAFPTVSDQDMCASISSDTGSAATTADSVNVECVSSEESSKPRTMSLCDRIRMCWRCC